MDDTNTPDPSANTSKAEDRWSSDADTVEQRDREHQGNQDRREGPAGGPDAGGITNRPLEEEEANQAAVPPRGESREGAHAGHGDDDRGER